MNILQMVLVFGSMEPEQEKAQRIVDERIEDGWALAEITSTTTVFAEEGEYPCVTTMTFIKDN